MPKVTYDAARGLIQESGSGIQFETMPFSPVQALSTASNGGDATVSAPGVYLFNAGGAATGSMPLASAYPGSMFIIRAGSAHAYSLTGSAEAVGTKVFTDAADGKIGSKLTLNNILGSSVALVSDGKSYLIMASSGSLTVGGT